MPVNLSRGASASTNSIPDNLRLLSADGSCLRNPGGAIGWAVVDCDGAFVAGSGAAAAEDHTNNIAELLALKAAMELLPIGDCAGCQLESDSQYAINSVTSWYLPTEARGGKTSAKKLRANDQLIRATRAALELRPGLELVRR